MDTKAPGMALNTLFITGGDYSWGSSRIRAFWPCEYMQNAKVLPLKDIIEHDGKLPRAINYIWQKAAEVTIMRQLKDLGLKNYIDFCDPSWWTEPKLVKTVCDEADGLIFGTQPLYDDFADEFGDGYRHVICPDGWRPQSYPVQRVHADVNPVRIIWFGLAANRFALLSVLPFLERLIANGNNIELTILDNEPDKIFTFANCPVYHTKFDPNMDNAVISSHDIALLPPYPGKWGTLKSNNRIISASASGLPVAYGDDYRELERLVKSAEYRKDKTIIPPDGWHVGHSAEILEKFLCE